MRTVYRRCCGLDVHKKSVTACVRIADEQGAVEERIRRFGTFTAELEELGKWLEEEQVESVAMESTGVYWKPVWNVLEGRRLQLRLVNAQHVRNVPGKKTDCKDSQWLAELEQVGWLSGSFVASRPLRGLRELTRLRATLEGEHSRTAQRVQKVLEGANIKLASVASNALGKSGRRMLQALAGGESDANVLAELALGKLRARLPELRQALQGQMQGHQAFQLKLLLRALRWQEGRIEEIDVRLRRDYGGGGVAGWKEEVEEAVQRLDTIPGVDWVLGVTIIAETGVEMQQFGTAERLASWGGLCPGNDESAGKRRSGKMRPGNRWLRRALCQAAWCATRAKGTYLQALYRRLAVHRGKKRALMAVAHTILVIVFHLLQRGSEYQELGGDFFQRTEREVLQQRYVRALKRLGYQVTLTSASATAD